MQTRQPRLQVFAPTSEHWGCAHHDYHQSAGMFPFPQAASHMPTGKYPHPTGGGGGGMPSPPPQAMPVDDDAAAGMRGSFDGNGWGGTRVTSSCELGPPAADPPLPPPTTRVFLSITSPRKGEMPREEGKGGEAKGITPIGGMYMGYNFSSVVSPIRRVSGDDGRVDGDTGDHGDWGSDHVIAALRSQYASPRVLAVFKGRGAAQGDGGDEEASILAVEEDADVGDGPGANTDRAAAAGHRLHSLHRAGQARREAKHLQAEREREDALRREATFSPAINRQRGRLRASDADDASVFDRLGVQHPREQRERRQEEADRAAAAALLRDGAHDSYLPPTAISGPEAAAMGRGEASPPRRAFTPRINEASHHYRPSTGRADPYASQQEWRANVDARLRAQREAAAASDRRSCTPTLNSRSVSMVRGKRGDGSHGPNPPHRGDVGAAAADRLLREGGAMAARRVALVARVTLEEKGRSGDNAPRRALVDATAAATAADGGDAFNRLYGDAEERRRREHEEERAHYFAQLTAGGAVGGHGHDRPFHPALNERSLALCREGPTSRALRGEAGDAHPPSVTDDVGGFISHYRRVERRPAKDGDGECAAAEMAHVLDKVPINPVSSRIALDRREREGVAHVPVHERLVAAAGDKGKLRPTTEVPAYSFTPTLNSRSVALDKRRNGWTSASHGGGEGGAGQNGRVELLHRSMWAQEQRLAALREERAAEEEAQLSTIRRQSVHYHHESQRRPYNGGAAGLHAREGDAGPTAGTTIPHGSSRREVQGSFEERLQAWAARRASRTEQQRAQRDEEEVRGCTFAPKLAKVPIFLSPAKASEQ